MSRRSRSRTGCEVLTALTRAGWHSEREFIYGMPVYFDPEALHRLVYLADLLAGAHNEPAGHGHQVDIAAAIADLVGVTQWGSVYIKPGALRRFAWQVNSASSGFYRVLSREGADQMTFVFAFQDAEKIGPRMLSRIGRALGRTRVGWIYIKPESGAGPG